MKKIFQHVCFLALILMSACSLEEIPNENFLENKEITTIEATTSSFSMDDLMSRVTIPMEEYPNFGTVTWAEGDTIGIYPNEGDQLSFPIVNGIGTNVCEFNGGGWALKTSKVYTAYTPFNRSYYQYMNKDALPISMLGQKQTGNNSSAHLSAYDIQTARDTAPESGKISFTFNHQVAFVRLDITAPCAGSWKSIILESTADFTTQATMDLTGETPTLTPTAQAHSVTLELENVQTTENQQLVAYMMMLPVDLTDKELTVKLVGTNDESYAVPANIVNNVKNFKAGTAKWITATLEEGNKLVNPFLTFTAESEQTFQMSSEVDQLEYSVNGSEWALLGTATIRFGGELGRLRLRGKNENGTNGSTVQFGNDVPVYCNGDIRTLLNYEEFETVNTENAKFNKLFYDCTCLVSAPELPATTLADNCYYEMFKNCTSLTTAPELPATTLAEDCYGSMFSGCTSLTTAPELPATTLTSGCYSGMFGYCTSLTTAPALPATTLAGGCYSQMFWGCTSLTTAPELPATTLTSYCYGDMFYGCTSLTTAPELPATTLADYCYYEMFWNCTSLTTAPPSLPATTLAEECYYKMFSDCTNLTTAPVLSATTLAEKCCGQMFFCCTSLTTAPALPATTLAKECYTEMFCGCTSLTTAPELPATTLAENCYEYMFFDCTSLTTAPALPATTLAKGCYHEMFRFCTSLTTAPELPATTLAEGCYYGMFAFCSNLNQVTMLATDISAFWCLDGWLGCVSETGTLIKASTMTSLDNLEIPSGWTVIDYNSEE